jgi:hypothetical protein
MIFTLGNIKKRKAIAVAIAAVMGYLKVSYALRESREDIRDSLGFRCSEWVTSKNSLLFLKYV